MPRLNRKGDTKGAGLKPETRYARQLFLFGHPETGQRVVNVKKLAKAADVHESTINAHIQSWEREYEEIVLGAQGHALAISLSEESLKEHSRDCEFLRDKLNSLRWEVDNLDEIIAGLEEIVRNISDLTESDKAVRLLENYLRSSMNRRSLLTLFIQVKKQWDEKVSLDALRDLSVVREKELQKHRARLDAKREEESGKKTERNVTPTAFFDTSDETTPE